MADDRARLTDKTEIVWKVGRAALRPLNKHLRHTLKTGNAIRITGIQRRTLIDRYNQLQRYFHFIQRINRVGLTVFDNRNSPGLKPRDEKSLSVENIQKRGNFWEGGNIRRVEIRRSKSLLRMYAGYRAEKKAQAENQNKELTHLPQ